jgi:hypothetical protein
LASPFTFKKYLKAKEELWKLKYFTMQKYYLQKKISVACAVGPSVSTPSTNFSFRNLDFWNLFEFSAAEIT